MTWWRYVRLAFWIIVPVILLILPADFFDKGQSLCLSVLLFKQECYACGLTRSIMHLIHFEFEDALYFNMLGLLVFPLLAYQWFLWFWQDWKFFRQQSKSTA
ncbi:MAG: DUF2752 domain-containing protein [Bacteroidota bacterium]